MNRSAFLGAAVGAALTALALAGSAYAEAVVTPVLEKDLPNAPGLRMTAIKVAYAPGEASGPHHHAASGFLIAYVLSGAVVSEVEGQGPARTYKAGESWTEGPGAHHLVSRNASRTEPAALLVVFIAPPGAALTTPDR
jgi:quercetin dioxygenase-like cupin family protein